MRKQNHINELLLSMSKLFEDGDMAIYNPLTEVDKKLRKILCCCKEKVEDEAEPAETD